MSSQCTTTFRLCWIGISLLALAGNLSAASDQIDLSLITTKGWVQFTVGGNWKVLSLDTKTFPQIALFQIPNAADEGTTDSTDASVMLFEVDSPKAAAGYERLREKYANGHKSRVGVWEIFKSDFKQKRTSYAGRVAYRDIADVHVCVVFAWPHLPRNEVGYDIKMEQTFVDLLKSVTGAMGKYPKEKGGVLRHPLSYSSLVGYLTRRS